MSLRPTLKRDQRLKVKAVYLIVTWDHDGYLTKTWVEGKREAYRTAETCRDDWHFKAVTDPIGPFRLDRPETATKDGENQ